MVRIRRKEYLICASYGLEPQYDDHEYRTVVDAAVLDELRAWSEGNLDQTIRPTGIRMRNLNPIIRLPMNDLELAWWGYLVDGATARFPSINSRSERLARSRSPLPEHAIVPASYWREMQKPQKVWHHLALPNRELLGLACELSSRVAAFWSLQMAGATQLIIPT